MKTTYIQTPLGITAIEGDENGVTKITTQTSADKPNDNHPIELATACHELKEYFKGSRTHFTFKLNPEGTNFQKKVWKALLEIPFGTTTSYLELSKKLGDVKAIRAVAAANGKNPIWVVIPCHRVIGSDGSLTGYAGGLWRKKWLLEHENPSPQTSLF
ncbi:methylated-DNA--[protein]-cysteine S-methyltransferase [Zhouia sp. PK063]|uniref:methylated-DNA--[protein]-cysteine S-methyltransferase n=1 Tax=Zhouia sp. PK063 TaxID=3373602 RepID=UPI003789F7EA